LCPAGVSQGRKPELVGGDLIRSLGGVETVKEAEIGPAESDEGRQLDTGWHIQAAGRK